MRPRILVVEHEATCPPAHFGRWLAGAGSDLSVCRPYAGDDVPATLGEYDALLVLGGSMGANEHDRFAEIAAAARSGVAQ